MVTLMPCSELCVYIARCTTQKIWLDEGKDRKNNYRLSLYHFLTVHRYNLIADVEESEVATLYMDSSCT